ncbi:hypothetical protein IFR05_005811 [Cadophora sp. M221]|nr:hypothetical protein IFR05_005811 [Cadophora sp. M221]
MHNFCRPSEDLMQGNGRMCLPKHFENWAPLGQFVNQFQGLRDLVWAAGGQIPSSVMVAISERQRRLHHHNFVLRSLVYDRNDIKHISPEDYALCTSPCLSSILVRFGSFGDRGVIDYTEEAVMEVISGLAPNLAHVCVLSQQFSGEISQNQTWELGRPAWKGLFPGTKEPATDSPSGRGRLQSLVFVSSEPQSIENWARRTDFSRLRCLYIDWDCHGLELAGIASRDELKSLRELKLGAADGESIQSQNSLNLLLSSLNPLQRLQLSGYISPETFNIIVRHHGENLRTLYLIPEANGEKLRNPLIKFSATILQDLASHNKTTKIPFVYLKEAFSNGAVDETLARGIFDLVSANGSNALRYLSVETIRKIGWNSLGAYEGQFRDTFRFFNRSFVCTRPRVCYYGAGSEVVVMELGMAYVKEAEEHWMSMMNDEEKWYEEEVFVQTFESLWSKRTGEGCLEWRSLPLDLEEGA